MFSTISIYWIISLIIIIGLVIYYSNTIEGLDNSSNDPSKYYESLNRVNNMLTLIGVKLRDGVILKDTAPYDRLNNQINYLTNVKKKFAFMIEQYRLNEQLSKLTALNAGSIQQEIDDLIQHLRKLEILNTETSTDTTDIQGTQSKIDKIIGELGELTNSTNTNVMISYDTPKIADIQKQIDVLMKQLRELMTLNTGKSLYWLQTSTDTTNIEDTQSTIDKIIGDLGELNKSKIQYMKTSSDTTNIQSKIDEINQEINTIIGDKIKTLIKESTIINKQMMDMRNNANTKTPPDMIYEKLDLMIQGKSTSYGTDASTTYTIPLKDNGDIDPEKFYDYIDDESVKRKADSVDQSGTAWVLDKDGNMVSLASQNKLNDYIKYYEPGSYKYDIQNYTPSYEDSVYLSKTTGKPAFSKFIDNASIKKGICSQYKDFPDKLDEECGKLDKNVCGSVNCCTLLGGSKCVAGNNQGPISKLHYGNQMIKNRDFYYYKGLCYGNCVKTKTDQ